MAKRVTAGTQRERMTPVPVLLATRESDMYHLPVRVAGLIPRPALLALLVVLSLAGLATMPPSGALAHAAYESSTPNDGEVVAESPPQITVVFSQEVSRSGGLPTLEVVNVSGDVVSSNAQLNDDDRTVMTADLNPGLPDGRYAILWHTVSAEDGEEAKGAAFFYVGEGPGPTGPAGTDVSATPRPTVTATPGGDEEEGDGVPVIVLVVGIIGGLVVGGGGGLLLGRRR
jgi:methionine-rich copper-binding protein CopC